MSGMNGISALRSVVLLCCDVASSPDGSGAVVDDVVTEAFGSSELLSFDSGRSERRLQHARFAEKWRFRGARCRRQDDCQRFVIGFGRSC